MRFPLISVIVPIYNEEKNISRCIDSLLKQSYSSYELLLIDDGSQDNSALIIDEYAAKYSFIRAYHKLNGGVSSARNLGLKVAHGEWVTFCDADDYVTPDWLRLFAIQINDSMVLVVQPFIQKESKIDGPIKNGKIFEGNVRAFLEIYFDKPMIGSLWNKLYSLSIIRKYQLQFNEFFKFREDEDFLVRYLKVLENNDTIVYTQCGGYYYVLPDFVAKYKNVENFFETLLSVFLQIKAIHQGTLVPRAYGYALKSLTHALWDLFLRNNKKAWKSLNTYHDEVRYNIMCIENFPLSFRVVLCLPPVLSYPCLRIMGLFIGSK